MINRRSYKGENLINLCNECNNRVNKNRNFWKEYFKNKIKEKKI